MDRRTVLKLGFAGAAGSLFIPHGVLAAEADSAVTSRLAGGVFYTKDRPGRWAKKVGGHLPMIERAGSRIQVTTGHPMKGFKHYIVKHTILDDKFQVVAEKMFDPLKDAPVSAHDIGELRNRVYVLSMCNIHDVWLNSLWL